MTLLLLLLLLLHRTYATIQTLAAHMFVSWRVLMSRFVTPDRHPATIEILVFFLLL